MSTDVAVANPSWVARSLGADSSSGWVVTADEAAAPGTVLSSPPAAPSGLSGARGEEGRGREENK